MDEKPNYEVLTCRLVEKDVARVFNPDETFAIAREQAKVMESKTEYIIAVVREGVWIDEKFSPQGKQWAAYSRCSPQDQFDRAKGRATAVGRALRARLEDTQAIPPYKKRRNLNGKTLSFSFPHTQLADFYVPVFEQRNGKLVRIGTEVAAIPTWMLTPAPPKEQKESEGKEQQG